ncbi:MAG: hypothetical protein IPM17_00135 [Verrucomicrobia bacterium]|nr:hypothetical protein [Verrucomicrobiota bacterium]
MKSPRNKTGSRLIVVVAAGALVGHAQLRWDGTDADVDHPAHAIGMASSLSGALTGGLSEASTLRVTPSRRRPVLVHPVAVPPAIPSVTPVGGGPGGGFAPQVFNFPVNRAIPDGDFSGLADSRILPAGLAPIQSVAVTLVLAPMGDGGFVGDLYATLTHESGGYAVLLNRLGRRPGSPFGYSDNLSLNLTLADAGPADIHQYRLTLTGSEVVPLTGTLTGLWQPSGRKTDPLAVLKDDPRDAMLSSFAGADQAGRWTLFVADVSGGGEYRLESWSLSITPVPEPAVVFGVLGLGALTWVLSHRLRRRRPSV